MRQTAEDKRTIHLTRAASHLAWVDFACAMDFIVNFVRCTTDFQWMTGSLFSAGANSLVKFTIG